MNAKVHNNLDAAFKSIRDVIGLLQERDAMPALDGVDHEQEINALATALENLRAVDKEFWD